MPDASTELAPALNARGAFFQKLSDYNQFAKLRLASLVVFSAGIGYIVAAGSTIDWRAMAIMLLGGFLITASANGLNQIIERNTDQLMHRTAKRPVASGRLSLFEAIMVSLLTGVVGIALIAFFTNMLSAALGLLSLLLYAFVYTPLKRVSPLSVLVGAFPGALPVLIGYSAYQGELNFEAGYLFFLQFIWQFPHFWAIAWVLHEDYTRGGFAMLPTRLPGREAAQQIFLYTASLIPLALIPGFTQHQSWVGVGVLVLSSCWFTWKAFQLYRFRTRVMFGSFIYLPIVQITYAADVLLSKHLGI
jgi:heme o synthase